MRSFQIFSKSIVSLVSSPSLVCPLKKTQKWKIYCVSDLDRGIIYEYDWDACDVWPFIYCLCRYFVPIMHKTIIMFGSSRPYHLRKSILFFFSRKFIIRYLWMGKTLISYASRHGIATDKKIWLRVRRNVPLCRANVPSNFGHRKLCVLFRTFAFLQNTWISHEHIRASKEFLQPENECKKATKKKRGKRKVLQWFGRCVRWNGLLFLWHFHVNSNICFPSKLGKQW